MILLPIDSKKLTDETLWSGTLITQYSPAQIYFGIRPPRRRPYFKH